MNFNPEKYSISDSPEVPFIDPAEIRELLKTKSPSTARLKEIIALSMDHKRLSMSETAELIAADDPDSTTMIMQAARELKQKVYGNRIVIFAPLYVGNRCINNCSYCGFRTSNRHSIRHTLSQDQLQKEVEGIIGTGHKRIIMVYGEHPVYNPEYIAKTVREAYSVKNGHDEIRRININAAPLSVEGFKTVKDAGIGTYQIFQETYDPEIYAKFHLGGPKSDYNYRLTAMDRAMQAGIDDVGLGVLLGLGDWRFELLALIRHTNHLEACFNVGPHTISFPRIQNASGVNQAKQLNSNVTDDDFMRMVAILRLAVPYTGLILTARETPELRDRLIEFGVSQIDAGSNIEIGGYSANEQFQKQHTEQTLAQDHKKNTFGQEQEINVDNTLHSKNTSHQNIDKEQFELGDMRSLAQITDELIASSQIPSFCTACYRKGRTGEHFMEFSTKGFIKRFCTPNALLTFAEYLEDHAPEKTKASGWRLIESELSRDTDASDCGKNIDNSYISEIISRLQRIKQGERDLYF